MASWNSGGAVVVDRRQPDDDPSAVRRRTARVVARVAATEAGCGDPRFDRVELLSPHFGGLYDLESLLATGGGRESGCGRRLRVVPVSG